MTTSTNHSFLSEIVAGEPIPLDRLSFFRARLQSRLYDLVITKFLKLEHGGEISRAELGRRIGKDPAQISRLLGAPGNWTLDTTSDLLLGMGEELEPSSLPLAGRPQRNYHRPEWVQPMVTVTIGNQAPSSGIRADVLEIRGDHDVRIAATG